MPLATGFGCPGLPQDARPQRVLIVEPDRLTMWSITTHLRRWFLVEAVTSGQTAEAFLNDQQVDGLILSNALPAGVPTALVQAARRRNPELRTVLMVTGDAEPTTAPNAVRIEKPFELNSLARLLGVPEEDTVEW